MSAQTQQITTKTIHHKTTKLTTNRNKKNQSLNPLRALSTQALLPDLPAEFHQVCAQICAHPLETTPEINRSFGSLLADILAELQAVCAQKGAHILWKKQLVELIGARNKAAHNFLLAGYQEKLEPLHCRDSTQILDGNAGVLLGTVAGRRCAPLDKYNVYNV